MGEAKSQASQVLGECPFCNVIARVNYTISLSQTQWYLTDFPKTEELDLRTLTPAGNVIIEQIIKTRNGVNGTMSWI